MKNKTNEGPCIISNLIKVLNIIKKDTGDLMVAARNKDGLIFKITGFSIINCSTDDSNEDQNIVFMCIEKQREPNKTK